MSHRHRKSGSISDSGWSRSHRGNGVVRRKSPQRQRDYLLSQMEAVLESINDAVVIADLQGNLLGMNREGLSMHGFRTLGEVRRHIAELSDCFEILDLDGRALPLEDWPMARAVRGERFFDYQVRVRNRQDDRLWVGSYNGTLAGDRDGNSILAVITIRDVTERRILEEQIHALNRDLAARVAELEEFNSDLESFNHMVSHDLRQPLNTIATSCQAVEMLCGDRLGEDCKKYVRIAYDRVLGMNDLIASLITLSRSGHSQMLRERMNLSELARSVMAEVKLQDPQRRVAFNIAEGVMATGDRGLMRLVLDNLIGNAWKYTRDRESAVIDFGTLESAGECCYFVRDNGRGFDMANADLLFIPFKRLPGAEHFNGFGIGLATVERIIRRHGGRIWAESGPDRGATFYFTLPAENPPDPISSGESHESADSR